MYNFDEIGMSIPCRLCMICIYILYQQQNQRNIAILNRIIPKEYITCIYLPTIYSTVEMTIMDEIKPIHVIQSKG